MYLFGTWQVYLYHYLAEQITYTLTMKTVEFEATVGEDGNLLVPETLKNDLLNKKVKVTLRYEAEADSKSPEHYTKGYDQKDTLYDTY